MTTPHQASGAQTARRVLLTIAGHDPLGGAGIIADAAVFTHFGFKAASVVTCLTAQDADGLHRIQAAVPSLLTEALLRCRTMLPPAGVKIGLLPEALLAETVAASLADYFGPVVLDPILWASGGQDIGDWMTRRVVREALLPCCSVITPNRREICALGEDDDPERAARNVSPLLRSGGAVLVTGVPCAEAPAGVADILVMARRKTRWFPTPGAPRLRELHGTGCHYSSALLASLCRGDAIPAAIKKAQRLVAQWDLLRRTPMPGEMDTL